MSLRHLHYFIAVADHGNFTRAAEALYVSQPALSQQIKQLEENLGSPLFDRSGRTTRLTDAGAVYLQYARQALQQLESGRRAIHDVQDLSRGQLRLAVTPTFSAWLMGPLLAEFSCRYPGIHVRLNELSQERIEPALLSDDADCGLAYDAPRSAGLNCTALFDETLAVVVSRQHPLAAVPDLSLTQLGDQRLILLTRDFATRGQIDDFFLHHNIAPTVMMEASSPGAVCEIVRHSQLATLLPAAIAHPASGLTALALRNAVLRRTAILLQRAQGWQTSAAQAFCQLCAERAAAIAGVAKIL
ncbi:transcriptional regulator CynR [Izhakiella australiensis]|uniref:Transcriptional regulator CynR n=1 Tax=Izhakiella australiensis TaxID=1926881 RepID=A0A1S8YRF2_9GAMM|nr:transcriptional regulator CynR [Izhakiella australiensis]OON41396.1 transcriptional regulator CynR [Izhakiella australiensis]